jgi:hypothetical protein
VTTLNEHLAAIDPSYVVHQVKEKFGTLRYYCVPNEPAPEPREAFKAAIREA